MSNNSVIIQDDSDNNEEIKIKRTRNRLTKKQQYVEERKDFIDKLNKLIGIDEKNNQVYLYDLENNIEIKNFIIENDTNIKKIFKTGGWGYYSNDESRGKNNITGLIRTIYYDCDYEISNKLKTNTFNNIKKQYTVLVFNKKSM